MQVLERSMVICTQIILLVFNRVYRNCAPFLEIKSHLTNVTERYPKKYASPANCVRCWTTNSQIFFACKMRYIDTTKKSNSFLLLFFFLNVMRRLEMKLFVHKTIAQLVQWLLLIDLGGLWKEYQNASQ